MLNILEDGVSLNPNFGNEATAIVLMSDVSHAATLSVCLESILQNCSKANLYDIVVLDTGLNVSDVRFLLQQALSMSNVSLRFIDVKQDFFKARITTLEHKDASRFACAWIADHMAGYCEVLYLGVNVVCTTDIANVVCGQGVEVLKQNERDAINGDALLDVDLCAESHLCVDGDVLYVKASMLACKMRGEISDCRYPESPESYIEIEDLIRPIPHEKIRRVTSSSVSEPSKCSGGIAGDPSGFIKFEGIALPCFHPTANCAQLFWKYARTSPYYEMLLALSSLSPFSEAEEITRIREGLRVGPLVSIVMPIYNAELFLHESINSILNQTYRNIELICVNDGSTDGSIGILHQYESVDPRVVVVDKENSGAGKTRNVGMKHVNGTYMCFVDSDDFLESCAIERLVDAAECNNADVVIFKIDQYDNVTGEFSPSNWAVSRSHIPPRRVFYPADIKHIYKYLVGFTVNKLYRASFLHELNLEFPAIGAHEDMPFTYIALSAAKRAYYLDEVLYHYRRSREGSLSDTTSKHYVYMFDALAYFERGLKERRLWEGNRRNFINYVLHMCVWKFNELGTYRRYEFKDSCRTKWLDEFGILNYDKEFFFEEEEYLFIEEALSMPLSHKAIARLVRCKDAHVEQ